MILGNSGGSLNSIKITGEGTVAFGGLPSTLTKLESVSATTNVNFTLDNQSINARTGVGNDRISIKGGISSVNTNAGHDAILISGGQNNVITGTGDDTIGIAGGVSQINTGEGDDFVSVDTGTATVFLGEGDDRIVVTNGGIDADIQTLDGGPGRYFRNCSNEI